MIQYTRPRLEKHTYVRENRKLYRWIPGNADDDDSDTDATTLEATGGYAGRWKSIGVIPAEPAEDVGELTDSTTGTASRAARAACVASAS